MHRIHKHQALPDTTFFKALLHLRCDVHIISAVWGFQNYLFPVGFHGSGCSEFQVTDNGIDPLLKAFPKRFKLRRIIHFSIGAEVVLDLRFGS